VTTAPSFIPGPFKRRSQALPDVVRDLSMLVGQVDLRASLTITDLADGSARVNIRVLNIAGERCSGVFRVHLFVAASAGGTLVTEWNILTAADGEAEQDLSVGAGTWYFHASVQGVYEVKRAVIT